MSSTGRMASVDLPVTDSHTDRQTDKSKISINYDIIVNLPFYSRTQALQSLVGDSSSKSTVQVLG